MPVKQRDRWLDHEGEGNQRSLQTLGFVSEEIVNLGGGSVVGNDGEALVVDVQDEVLALLEGRICGENPCDMETINLTMTAKPMRPISPLEIDNSCERDRGRYWGMQGRTLVQTLSGMGFGVERDGRRRN